MRDCHAYTVRRQALNYADTCTDKKTYGTMIRLSSLRRRRLLNRTAIDLQLFLTKRIVMMTIDIPRESQNFSLTKDFIVVYHIMRVPISFCFEKDIKKNISKEI